MSKFQADGDDLHANCKGTNADLLRMSGMLEKNPGLIDRVGDSNNHVNFCGKMTPLQGAVHRRHVACVEFLIERGANVDAQNAEGYTALYCTIFGNNTELLRLLLERGANPNYETSYQTPSCPSTSDSTQQEGGTPRRRNYQRDVYARSKSWYIDLACKFGFTHIMEILLSYGAQVEDLNFPLRSSITYTSTLIKNPDCLLLALRNGAVVTYRQVPPEYQTPENMTASLIHSSITPSFIDGSAFVENISRIWTILREFGDDFYFKNEEGLTALQRLRETYMPFNFNKILEPILVEMMSRPLSLQSSCRIAIRRCMGIDCHKRLHLLTNIPRDIRGYLNYDKL